MLVIDSPKVRVPAFGHGSIVSVLSPDRVRHVGRIVGLSPSATVVAILVERVRESELRWNDARGRAALAVAPFGTLTLHFDTGAVYGPDANDPDSSRRVRYPTTLKDSVDGSGLAEGVWGDATGWKWTRAKEQPKSANKPVRTVKPVRETGPSPFDADDFDGIDDHDGEGA